MNCPACLGKLWLEDHKGDWFKCLNCNATGEANRAIARIYSLSDARAARKRAHIKAVVSNTPPDKAG